MSKGVKIWLITATSLILAGCIIFGGVMAVLKWDFTKLCTIKYETNKYEINEVFKNISVITDTAEVIFTPCESDKVSVVCYEQKNIRHLVTVNNNTLLIEVNDTRKWYEYISINFGKPKITVYLPQGEYGSLTINNSTGLIEVPKNFNFESIDITASTGNVKISASALSTVNIKTSTGDITAQDLSASELNLSVSTGKITASNIKSQGDIKATVSTGKANLTNVECENLITSGNTGDIILKNVIATEDFSIERSTGDVTFDGCDAKDITVKTDTGNVKGSLLSDKVFITKTSTGKINVPKTTTGGKCEITTDTGDIKITVN